ncbi:MAG TPA: hypothetical protein VG797_08375 [Phycisphaerales bacterium]|nr:hypothetical protein [Phycisphaerales bacterium]
MTPDKRSAANRSTFPTTKMIRRSVPSALPPIGRGMLERIETISPGKSGLTRSRDSMMSPSCLRATTSKPKHLDQNSHD